MLKYLFIIFLIVCIGLLFWNDYLDKKLKVTEHQNRLDIINLNQISTNSKRNQTNDTTSATVDNAVESTKPPHRTCCNSFYELSDKYSLPRLNQICDLIPVEVECMRKCLEIREDKRAEFNLEVSNNIEEWIEQRLSFEEMICSKIKKEINFHSKQILTNVIPIELSKMQSKNNRLSKEEVFNLIKSISANLGLNQMNSFENQFLSNDQKSNKFLVNKRGIEIIKHLRLTSKLLFKENSESDLRSRALGHQQHQQHLQQQQHHHLEQKPQQYQHAFINQNQPISTGAHYRFNDNAHSNLQSVHFPHLPYASENRYYQPPANTYHQQYHQPISANRKKNVDLETDEKKSKNRVYRNVNNEVEDYNTYDSVSDDNLLSPTQISIDNLNSNEYKASSINKEVFITSTISNDENFTQSSVIKLDLPRSSLDTKFVDDLTNESSEFKDHITSTSSSIDNSNEINSDIIDELKINDEQSSFITQRSTQKKSAVEERNSNGTYNMSNSTDSFIQITYRCVPVDSLNDRHNLTIINKTEANQLFINNVTNIIDKIVDKQSKSKESINEKRSNSREELIDDSKLIVNSSTKINHKIENSQINQTEFNNQTAQTNRIDHTGKTSQDNELKERSLSTIFGWGSKTEDKQIDSKDLENALEFDRLPSKMITQLSSPQHEEIVNLANEVVKNHSDNCHQQFTPNLSNLLALNLRIKHGSDDYQLSRMNDLTGLCNELLVVGGKLNALISQNCPISAEMDFMIKHVFNETTLSFEYCLNITNLVSKNRTGKFVDSESGVVTHFDHLDFNKTELDHQLSEKQQLSKLIDCLNLNKLVSCQKEFIPWFEFIDKDDLKRFTNSSSIQLNELNLFKKNLTSLIDNNMISAHNCKDIFLFKNCIKDDLDALMNTDDKGGNNSSQIQDNDCNLDGLNRNALSINLSNRILNQVNEKTISFCPKLSTILNLDKNVNQTQKDAYRNGITSHFAKKYTEMVDDEACSESSSLFMKHCINMFNSHMDLAYVQLYKNFELQNHFNRMFIPNEEILPRVCCAQRQLARCFISGANFNCPRDKERSVRLLALGELDFCAEVNSKLSMSTCRDILSIKDRLISSKSYSLISNWYLILVILLLSFFFS